jgi:hypothetical protein
VMGYPSFYGDNLLFCPGATEGKALKYALEAFKYTVFLPDK